MKSKVFCLILNYNRPEDTVQAVKSLQASRVPQGTQFIIIDNWKVDQQKYFEGNLGNIHYIKSPGNIGFAAGNNLGIAYALAREATHILIMNPDVIVPKNFLLPLLKSLSLHSKVGIIAPAHTEGRGSYGLGGQINWQLARFDHANTPILPRSSRYYDLLTFACVLIKAEVFRKVGMMDERYFLYLEDVDYCVSIKKAGYKLLLDPTVVVRHKTSSSFDDPRGKLKYSFRSSLIFINKWYRFPANLLPFLHTFYFYPTTYMLWSMKIYKRKVLSWFR